MTKDGEIALNPPRAVFWLEGNFSRSDAQPVAQMAQKNLAFVTPLRPVRVGTKVEFPNLDDGFHNIFSYSSAMRFDLGRYRPEERPIPSQIFETSGLVTLRCDIRELIMVLESPHFTVSKTDGTFPARQPACLPGATNSKLG